jgi:arylsulfatase A-like enzyme
MILAPGSVALALLMCVPLQKVLKRHKIPGGVRPVLIFHAVTSSCSIVLVAIAYGTGSGKWAGLLIGLLALGFSGFVWLSKTVKRPIGLLVMTDVVVVGSMVTLPFAPPGTEKLPLPNVMFISIDTLRPDHLGCYGYESGSTPNIDRIAEEGITFGEAVAPSPRTGPSHISMLTGLYPNHHGATRNGESIAQQVLTLPEILSGSGYHTAGFVSGWPLRDEASGLASRFREYSENFSPLPWLPEVTFKLRLLNLAVVSGPKLGLFSLRRVERNAALTTAEVARWLQRNKDNPFFLWVHYYDPHLPYSPPATGQEKSARNHQNQMNGDWWRWNTAEREELVTDKNLSDQLILLYDEEISYVDAEIGRLHQKLKDLQLDNNTLIVITADHGESLGEHDSYFGHDDLFDTCLKVPLIMKYPAGQWTHQQISHQTRLIDIAPTILDVLSIETQTQFDGKSLLPVINNQVANESEEALAALLENQSEMYSVRKQGFKLLWTAPKWVGSFRLPPKEAFYDLQSDPGELHDVLGEKPALLPEFQRLMAQWRNEKTTVEQNLSEEAKEKLKSLGYIR